MRVMHILRAEAQQNCTSDAHDSVCNNNNSSYSLTEYITCSQWLRNVELVLAFAVTLFWRAEPVTSSHLENR